MDLVGARWLGGRAKALSPTREPLRHIQVISCILPSGQNWIYNILLE
jgi:hypothetical protein